MRPLNAYEKLLAEECAARHRTPKATVTHPQGVIIERDITLHENIKDPDYVPYCGPCVPFQRVRRVADGFQCPTCGNKSNWDLSKFNGNIDVKFDPEHMDDAARDWVGKQELLRQREAMHAATYAEFKRELLEPEEVKAVTPTPAPERDWSEDKGKKNTAFHLCGKCTVNFFGKRSRKYCVLCQNVVSANLKSRVKSPWSSEVYDYPAHQERKRGNFR